MTFNAGDKGTSWHCDGLNGRTIISVIQCIAVTYSSYYIPFASNANRNARETYCLDFVKYCFYSHVILNIAISVNSNQRSNTQ